MILKYSVRFKGWLKTGTETRSNVLFVTNDCFVCSMVEGKVLSFLIVNRKYIWKNYKYLKDNV